MAKSLVYLFAILIVAMLIFVFKENPLCVFSNDPIMCIQIGNIKK